MKDAQPQKPHGRGDSPTGVAVFCGATTRAGTPCRKTAGWGTDHQGQGRCRLHGGATPIRHGRYSKVNRTRLRSLIEEYEADPDPLNVLPELGAARALFVDFIERYDEWRDAFLAWHASFGDGYLEHMKAIAEQWADEENEEILGELRRAYEAAKAAGLLPLDPLLFEKKPRQVLDVSDAMRHLDTIAKIAQREKKLRLEGAISRKDLLRIFTEQRRVIEHEVLDLAVQQRILDGFRSISLA